MPADPIFLSFASSILVACLIGYLVVDRLCPSTCPRYLVMAFAPVTGLGICSLIVYFFRRPMIAVEGVLLIILLILWFRTHGLPRREWFAAKSLRIPIFAVIFAIALGWSVGSSVTHVIRYPHGLTDGWAIWNSHAKYLNAGGPTWRQDLENTFHPDYPLLFPGVVVHAWRYIGNMAPDASGYVGIVFQLAGLAVLIGSLVRMRQSTVALLMGFVLLGSWSYVNSAVSEYADVPLSVFILSTVALICLYENESSKPMGLMVLAGFMAGCAAWTKNEGLPFLLLTSGVLLLPLFWKPSLTLRRIFGFAAGLALPLAAIIHFKWTAPPNDIMASVNRAALLAKILNPDRHFLILQHFRASGWAFAGWTYNPYIPILLFIVLGGVDMAVLRSFSWRAGLAIFVMMLASYYAIYVITPLDLTYHLESSLDRLLLHLWPLCLLLAGMTARTSSFGNSGRTSGAR